MPNRDGTGPMGAGKGVGRGMGPCGTTEKQLDNKGKVPSQTTEKQLDGGRVGNPAETTEKQLEKGRGQCGCGKSQGGGQGRRKGTNGITYYT